jgi:hypothetical protein
VNDELTDEQVMQPPQVAQREMTDQEVIQPPKDLFTTAVQGAVEATPKGYFGRIVDRFKSGAAEGYGDEPFGFSDANKKWLTDSTNETYKAFADNVLIPAVAQLDKTWRTPNSIYHAFGDALIEAGVPRDFVAMPEAFMGSPKPTGMFESPRLAKPAIEAEAPPKPSPIEQAVDLNVIGPQKPKLSEGTPEQAATEATAPKLAAAAQKDEKVTGEAPGETNPWEDRFNQFVGKLDTPGDVQQLIRDAAQENDNFPAARQGDIPLSHVEGLADAAGVEPSTVDPTGVGRLMRNDQEVRVGMRIMLQATENVKDAARAVKEEATPENLAALQESMLRRNMAVEQIVGQRAEWGRTGNVFQEFMKDIREAEDLNKTIKDKTGNTPQDLRDIADLIDQADRTQAARILSDAQKKAPAPFYWTWVNGLISGWLTHTKYVAANALYAVSENGIVPPIAATIGKAKQLMGAETDRVFFGETMASTWGMVSAVPEAFMASAKSVASGSRYVLKSELDLYQSALDARNEAIAAGEKPPKIPKALERTVNQVTGQGRPTDKLFGVVPLNGIWGRIIGAPGDAAMGIHTFFKVLGERAGLKAEAYRAAADEGLSPTQGQFWNRMGDHAENPTDAMRERAVEGAYKGTFMTDLGPKGKAFQALVKEIPLMKWIFPFLHIPINLMKATYEHTGLAMLDADLRADLMGKNGGVKQDKAISRMVVGSAIMGYFVQNAMMGRATGDYPLDPKERDAWKLAGKQPNSLLIGNTWISYNKFGPAGDLANLSANIAEVVHTLKGGDDDAMTKGTYQAAHAAARLMVDEVGFQSLANLFEAMQEERKGVQWAARTAGSFVPFSSFLGQTASYRDPYMRDVKTFFDGIKSVVPGARETILPKRDWLGEPIPNAQYGNIIRQRQALNDPVNMEMGRLQIHPGPPSDRVGGVKMEPEMYDRYQAVAGTLTKQTLDSIVSSPGWKEQPDFVRETALRSAIRSTRDMAAGAMQAANPSLIQQGLKQKLDHITGVTHTDKPKHAPALE